MWCRGECGSSSPTATSASRRSRIEADRRAAHALRQQGAGLLSGTPHRAAQRRIGRGEDVFVAKPGGSRMPAGGAVRINSQKKKPNPCGGRGLSHDLRPDEVARMRRVTFAEITLGDEPQVAGATSS